MNIKVVHNPIKPRVDLLLIPLIILLCSISAVESEAHILKLEDGTNVSFSRLIDDLTGVKLVFVGEHHDNPHHHRAQLQIIDALHKAGADVVLGLEMFRSDNQESLDKWVRGEISPADFRKVFRENWSWWEQYRNIFLYARKEKLSMIGLNIPRRIIRQVARNGFSSLSDDQLAELPVVQCIVGPEYQEFIRRALGKHSLTDANFKNFCEAQLLWDKTMAKNLKGFLTDNPDKTVVVLAGNGHAWKHGIPAQLEIMREKSWRVLLPEFPGRIEKGLVSHRDADYLLIGTSQGPIH